MTGSTHTRIARLQQGRKRDGSHADDHERGRTEARSWTPAGGGRPLDPLLRRDMERSFRHDFSGVRVHDDPDAAASAKALAAKAFTVGKDIFFSQGRHAPDTPSGKRLLAHELAHVVQQGRGGAAPTLDPGSSLEISARSAADAAVSGSGPVAVAGASGVGVAREEDDDEKEKDVADMNTLVQLHKQRKAAGVPPSQADDTHYIDNWESKGKGTLAEVTVPHALYSGWDWNHVGGGFETGSSRTSLARQTPYSKDPSAGIDFIVENVETGRLVIGEQKAVAKATFDNATATTVNLETNLEHAIGTLEKKLASGDVTHPEGVKSLEGTIARLKATQQAVKNQTDLPEGVVFELTNLSGKGEKIGKNHIDNLAKRYEKNPAFLEHLLSRTFVRDPDLAKKSGRDPAGKKGTDADPDIVPATDILTPDAQDTLERIRQGKTEKQWKNEKKVQKAEKLAAEKAEKLRIKEEKKAATKARNEEKKRVRKQESEERKRQRKLASEERRRQAAAEKKQNKAKAGKRTPAKAPEGDAKSKPVPRGKKAPARAPATAAGTSPPVEATPPAEVAPKPAPESPAPEKAAKTPAAKSQPTAKKAAKAKPRPKKLADGGAGDGPTPTQTEPAKTPTGDTPAVETAPKAPAPTNGEAPGEGKRPAPGDNEGGGKKPSPRKPTPGEKADAAGGKVAHAANQAAALIRAHDAYDEHRKDGPAAAALAGAVAYFENSNIVGGAIANARAKREDGQDPVEAWISTIGETGAGFVVPGSGVDQAINGIDNLVGAAEDHALRDDPERHEKSRKASAKTVTDFVAGMTPSKMFSQTIGAGARSYYDIGKFIGGDTSGVDKFGDDAVRGKLGMVLQPLGMAADFVGNLGSGEGAGRALDKTLEKGKGSTTEKIGSAGGDAFYKLGQSNEAKSGKYGFMAQGWAQVSSVGTDLILGKDVKQALNNAVLPESNNFGGPAAGVLATIEVAQDAKAAIENKASEIKAEATQSYENAKTSINRAFSWRRWRP